MLFRYPMNDTDTGEYDTLRIQVSACVLCPQRHKTKRSEHQSLDPRSYLAQDYSGSGLDAEASAYVTLTGSYVELDGRQQDYIQLPYEALGPKLANVGSYSVVSWLYAYKVDRCPTLLNTAPTALPFPNHSVLYVRSRRWRASSLLRRTRTVRRESQKDNVLPYDVDLIRSSDLWPQVPVSCLSPSSETKTVSSLPLPQGKELLDMIRCAAPILRSPSRPMSGEYRRQQALTSY